MAVLFSPSFLLPRSSQQTPRNSAGSNEKEGGAERNKAGTNDETTPTPDDAAGMRKALKRGLGSSWHSSSGPSRSRAAHSKLQALTARATTKRKFSRPGLRRASAGALHARPPLQRGQSTMLGESSAKALAAISGTEVSGLGLSSATGGEGEPLWFKLRFLRCSQISRSSVALNDDITDFDDFFRPQRKKTMRIGEEDSNEEEEEDKDEFEGDSDDERDVHWAAQLVLGKINEARGGLNTGKLMSAAPRASRRLEDQEKHRGSFNFGFVSPLEVGVGRGVEWVSHEGDCERLAMLRLAVRYKLPASVIDRAMTLETERSRMFPFGDEYFAILPVFRLTGNCLRQTAESAETHIPAKPEIEWCQVRSVWWSIVDRTRNR